MKLETQGLVQIKSTKKVLMHHILETGNVLLQVNGEKNEETKVTPMYLIEIPNSNVWSVIRGLLSDRQRYYRRHRH